MKDQTRPVLTLVCAMTLIAILMVSVIACSHSIVTPTQQDSIPPTIPSATIGPLLNPNMIGSTCANALNGGKFAMEDGWLYASINSELVKTRPDGSSKCVLDEECGYSPCINVIDGWIYYWNTNVFPAILYKIRTDGSSKEKLYQQDSSCSTNWCCDRVIGDWVYVTDMYPVDAGGEKYNFPAYKIVRIDTDGNKRECIAEDLYDLWGFFPCYDVIDGWVYYTEVNWDLLDFLDTYDLRGSNIKDEWLFSLCRCDGNERYIITDELLSPKFWISDGWVYYFDQQFGISRISLKNEITEQVTEWEDWNLGSYSFIEMIDGALYLGDYGGDILRMDISTGVSQSLTSDFWSSYKSYYCTEITLLSGWFYYLCYDIDNGSFHNIARTKLDGSVTEIIFTY